MSGDASASRPAQTLVAVLAAISVSHLLHDTIQSLVPAIYPLLKTSFDLSFAQIGMITFTLQGTAAVLQPAIGYYTDHHPQPYALVGGMVASFTGLVLLGLATQVWMLLVGAGLIGLGSAVFHPESSRVARLAAGGRLGLAQSVFQVGGNAGSSLGPLIAAFVVVRFGRVSVAWCAVLALVAMLLLWRVGRWSAARRVADARGGADRDRAATSAERWPREVQIALAVLLALVFSKFVYMASLTSFYTFYLISRFGVSVPRAQLDLFIFLAAVAAGTVIGGPVGDRWGRKRVIWLSIFGVLPFTLLLPYASLQWTRVLTVVIGLVLASGFSAILVFATELVPSRVGLIAGLFFGTAFGIAGLSAAVLGFVADRTSVEFVYRVCSVLPAIGLLTAVLPERNGRN